MWVNIQRLSDRPTNLEYRKSPTGLSGIQKRKPLKTIKSEIWECNESHKAVKIRETEMKEQAEILRDTITPLYEIELKSVEQEQSLNKPIDMLEGSEHT